MGDESLVSIAVEKCNEGKLPAKDFRDVLKYLEMAHKDLMKLERKVTEAGSQGLMIDGQLVNRTTLKSANEAFCHQLSELNKIYRARNKKKGGDSKHLKDIFYVSDQLAELYRDVDFGLGKTFQKDMKLVTEKRIATGSMLTSLMTRYCRTLPKNEDKSYELTEELRETLSDTRFMLHGKDLGESFHPEDPHTTTNRKILERIENGEYSVFELLNGVKDKNGKVLVSEDRFLHGALMKFNSHFRIPKDLLSEQQLAVLADPKLKSQAESIQGRLNDATNKEKEEEKEERKRISAEKKKEREEKKRKEKKKEEKEKKKGKSKK